MPSPDTSPNLGLPFLMPAQAQKHVTHNEALELLDLLAQLVVQTFATTTPPAAPAEGQVWALGAAPNGVWTGQAHHLALWRNGGWVFVAPRRGWLATGLADGSVRIWSGMDWQRMQMDNLDGLGIGTVHDATNRLAVAAPATLLSHAGSSHRLVLNKATTPDTASLLFQNAWSGRVEMGLTGTDMLTVRTSPDGTAWQTVLQADTTGLQVTGQISGTAVMQSATDATEGRLPVLRAAGGIFGLAGTSYADLDPNAAGLRTGAFRTNAALTDFSGFGHTLHLSRVVNAQGAQIALRDGTASATPLAAIRHRGGDGVWAQWNLLIGRRNLLGHVSQSGGVPTGAVIQRGSNANGEFVRFADGTQICTTTNLVMPVAGTSHGALFRSAAVTWVFPASFALMPAVSGSVSAFGGWLSINTVTAGQATGLRLAPVSDTDTPVAQLVAIGRWF
jgi:hypothetical protein